MTDRDRLVAKPNEDSGYAIRKLLNNVYSEVNHVPFSNGSSRCVDVVDGSRNDHPLLITHLNKEAKIERLNGNDGIVGSKTYRQFIDYVPEYYRGVSSAPTHLAISLPSTSQATTSLLARSNPSRPSVSLPVFIGEMKDLPGMAKDIWRDFARSKQVVKNFHQQVGSHYLMGVYGFAPLISDLIKLGQFQKTASRRANEFQRLYSNSGLKRRLLLSEATMKGAKTNITVESTHSTIVCRHQIVTTGKQWGTVRWLPTSLPPTSRDDPKYMRMAQNVILGLGPRFNATDWKSSRARNDWWSDASDAWNLMPWSWMADWFGNMGEYLAAQRNSVPAVPTRINIMVETRSISTFTPLPSNPSWAKGGGASLSRVTKARAQGAGPDLTAGIPFLSGSQLSILGALGLQRLKRR